VKDAPLTCPPGIETVVGGPDLLGKAPRRRLGGQIEQTSSTDGEELQDEIRILHEETKKRLVQPRRAYARPTDATAVSG
jgi:hypothetical protein